MLEEQLITDFATRLREEAEEKLGEFDEQTLLAADAALAEVMLGYLEEAGVIQEHELCPHEDSTGRNRCRIIGYALPEDSNRLELFSARFCEENHPPTLPASEVAKLTGRAARFFGYAARRDLTRFAGNAPAEAAARLIADRIDRIEDVRVHVLTNAIVKERGVEEIEIEGRRVEFEVVDLERLFRACGEDITRDKIEIDFEAMLGRPITCLEMTPRPTEYQTFLLILSGDLIYRLYEQYGARLFEFNVRSFLQAKGQVNKGIRDTLRTEPERFLAFNNGLTATADEIEAGTYLGETVIKRLKGLQIVNGAQTTASIHRAKKVDKIDVSRVAVAMKLTRVHPAKLTEFVPLIARYANTQNVIQIADLSANNEFHIALERLSERIWCPGEESRWFYERARGAYQVAMARRGTTPARKREFERECPKNNRFGKTDLAKFLMSWWQRPQVVSRGAQKNFSVFMAELPERFTPGWQPDEVFYKDTVALAILFKAAQRAVRRAKLQSYGANVVTYMVAKLAFEYGSRLDLEAIWEAQEISAELARIFEDWAPLVHTALIQGAAGRNVTEWCKKDGCWENVQALRLDFPSPPPPEFAPNGGEHALDQYGGTHHQLVELCCSLSGPDWAKVMAWASQPGRVAEFDRRVAHTVAGYALQGWQKRPTEKQARFAARVLEAAMRAGVLEAA